MVKLSDEAINPKPYITKEAILDRFSGFQLFQLYVPGLQVGKPTISPLRKEVNPSFSVFLAKDKGVWLFKDHASGASGDIFNFLSRFWQTDFQGVLSGLCYDLNLNSQYKVYATYNDQVKHIKRKYMEVKDLKETPKVSKKTITIEQRPWEQTDIKFWASFGIKLSTLRKYRVVPILGYRVTIDDSMFNYTVDKNAYAFMENKDDNKAYKIYQPFNTENRKWRNSQDSSVWHGWEQLPKEGDTLFITKSLKDVMSIKDVLGIPAVSMQSETTIPKKKVMEDLLSRFLNVYIFYDNDYENENNPGQTSAKKLCKEYPKLMNLAIDEKYESKDFSDLYKNWGESYSNKIIIEMLEKSGWCPF